MARMRVSGRVVMLLAAALVLALAAGAGTVSAAQGQGPGQGKGPGHGPCAEDVAKLCKDVQPGGGRILNCLKQNEAAVSPGCKQHLAEVKHRVQEAREACHDDVLRFCGDVKPGGGRIISCLKQHENELSGDCKAKMAEKRGPRQK